MAKKIVVRDRGVVIGSVTEGGTWLDAPGHRSTDILLAGGSYAQIEQFFYQRSQYRSPEVSEGRTYQDEYSFHFSDV
ncbi:hypothetical protein [Leucobacter chromiireducens]|uniref:Uncharacterized protein n=1 Tax=Leucobacter chromiireducens subsp. solipictus TaxID=398235 RepID=A0ABS1SGF8_9MICO|nr:hypothetical protein [Leucobacter chromiireducens]MBL3679550.1 hypothetical protein [Leucobacter chromiireducens subsp. solipictus]